MWSCSRKKSKSNGCVKTHPFDVVERSIEDKLKKWFFEVAYNLQQMAAQQGFTALQLQFDDLYDMIPKTQGGIAMRVQESGEMYLEAIWVLNQKNGFVRSIDVSEYLGYSKPSVSRAMGILRKGEFIVVDKDGGITLTDAGREIAEKIYERHTILTKLLMMLGVSEETAAADACKLEHAISDESFQAIKAHAARFK